MDWNEKNSNANPWPELPSFDAWQGTCETLHRWTQVVGKVRLVLTPWVNHSWHVPLYVTPRGLTTSPIAHGSRVFQIDFDFLNHQLLVQTSTGAEAEINLQPRSVADFYAEVMARLDALGLGVRIRTTPNEVEDATPFDEDDHHADYDAAAVERFGRALVQMDRVFKQFRAGFVGKSSPVHFFWGSFDLALTRFSGRPAPEHPAGIPGLPDWVAREAYSHEVSSAGFWPGGTPHPQPVFYSYAYPEPDGFREADARPDAARYSKDLGEFALLYEDVQQAAAPDAALLAFLESTYAAAADLGGWNREALEWEEHPAPHHPASANVRA